MSGGKLIVTRTLAVLRTFLFAAFTRFAILGFPSPVTICHHIGEQNTSVWKGVSHAASTRRVGSDR